MKQSHVVNPALFPLIKDFVRGELGCSCPDAVFETISVQQDPVPFKGLPGDLLLAVGGRLLIVLIGTGHWQALTRALEQLVRRGREVRDAEGFNRIRFVVAAPDIDAAESRLRESFNALPFLDDRMHLHIIAPQRLRALRLGLEQRMPGP